MSDEAVIEGVVTDTYEQLLAFEVNNTTVVHMGLMFVKDHTEFPTKGAEVKASSRFFNSNEFSISSMVLTADSQFETDLSVTLSDRTFADTLNAFKVSPTYFLKFARNYDNLKTFLKSTERVSHGELLFSVITKLKHARFQLEFVSQKKYIDNNPDAYKDFSYWTLGNHNNWDFDEEEKYLIGMLKINTKTGGIYFTDFTRDMPCLLINSSDSDIQSFLNSYVLIRDFTFITEIYNSNKVTVLEYLLVNALRIIKLDINSSEQMETNSNSAKKSCTIMSKSMPVVVAPNKVCYWLQIQMEHRSKIFLRLDEPLLAIYLLIKVGYNCDIHFKSSPTKTYNKEVYRTDSSISQLKAAPDTQFIPREKNASVKLLTAAEAYQILSSSDLSLVSFEATISLKKFVNPLPSRTTAVTNDPNFGTPGVKTHVLEFRTDNTPLVLYLNNWENLALPYGLIPNMRVIVRNVKPQSRSYYKSTILTSIETVTYEPKIKFESAVLMEKNWGVPFYFGTGHLIPNGVIIYATTMSLFVLGLKIRNEKSSNGQVRLMAQITLIVVDQMGESKVIAKEKGGLLLLRLLLQMHEPAFKKWCQGMPDYEYYKGMTDTCFDRREDLPQAVFTYYLQSLETLSLRLHLKCRKMDDEPNGTAVYFFLDGFF